MRWSMRLTGMALALCLLLAGCGGGSSATTSRTSSSTTTTATATAKPSATSKTTSSSTAGVPAPSALSDFQCVPDTKGVWGATGVLTNASNKPVTYQVTVFVGVANGQSGSALTKQYPMVNASGSINVSMPKLPAATGASSCYVQVLATPGA